MCELKFLFLNNTSISTEVWFTSVIAGEFEGDSSEQKGDNGSLLTVATETEREYNDHLESFDWTVVEQVLGATDYVWFVQSFGSPATSIAAFFPP